MALRYALLSGHPRKQLNFTLEQLHAAKSALKTLREYRSTLPENTTGAYDTFGHVITALHDDLNTPAALGALFTVVNRKGGEADRASFDRAMFALGLDLKQPERKTSQISFTASASLSVTATATAYTVTYVGEPSDEIKALAQKRWAAKAAKDFKAADALRAELAAAGWSMLDRKDGYSLEPLKK
jgi:cysteinyl-tRNA synthetase